jgi:hypothetical protein
MYSYNNYYISSILPLSMVVLLDFGTVPTGVTSGTWTANPSEEHEFTHGF